MLLLSPLRTMAGRWLRPRGTELDRRCRRRRRRTETKPNRGYAGSCGCLRRLSGFCVSSGTSDGGPPLPWTVTTLGSLGTGGTPMVTKYQKFADGYKAEAVKLYRE